VRWAELTSIWYRRISAVPEILGNLLGWLCAAMVVITVTVVILRYGFSIGSIALQESVTYLHGLLFMLGASVALHHNGHVRVDVFYRGFSTYRKAIVDLIGTLLLLVPFCLFTLFWSYDYVAASWRVFEGSADAGGIRGVFLLKSLIPLMATLLMLQAAAEVLRCLLTIAGRPPTKVMAGEEFL